ncbi:MAG TPA: T9SS type A sorting domain-containing protein [Rhodothermales bacterium]|nr:T9SS type A sorting domain-containing protein [Rhodothermales bacterium]
MPLASGDEIAVLAPDESCVGVVVWRGISTAIAAWGADNYSQNGGYKAGDPIRFAVWDASEQIEYTEVEVSYATSSSFLRTDGIYGNGAIFELSSFAAVGTGNDGTVPILQSPGRDAAGLPMQLELSWSAVAGATSYDLQVSANTGFSPLVAGVSGISGTSQVVEGLSKGTVYYWRVRAVTADGAGAYSPARKFSTVATQSIALQQGWNIVSSYVEPSSSDMETVFEPVSEQLVLAKDGDGKVFSPESDINDIGSWKPTRAYKVYMEAPASIAITGALVAPGKTPVALQQGWNMFAYLRESEMPVSQAVADIGEDLVLLKDNFGNVFMPELGIDDVGTLQPGQGYVAYVREAASFTYPTNTAKTAGKRVAVQAHMMSSPPKGIGYSAHIVSRTALLPEGEHLTAWSGSRQVGSGAVEDSTVVVMVIGDDPLTPNVVEGARAGDRIVLKQGSDVSGTELKFEAIRDVLTGAEDASLVYRNDAVWEVSIAASSVGTGSDLPLQFGLEQSYPNPFRSNATIRYTLDNEAHVQLEVFNMLGQRVRVLVSEEKRAGQYEISFDGGDLSSGTYFYRLQAGNRTETKSMVLVK